MKSGSVLVRKQPPPAVLIDEVFEFVAESESSSEDRDLEWVVDPRVKVVQEPRKARHGNPTLFRCCFTQSSNVATPISISLTKKDGTIVSSTSTAPVSTAMSKVLVSKTPEWSDVWFKDEGGREKCMELIAGVYNQRKDLIKSTSTVQISLCYATNHHGTVPVANQDILRLLNTDLRAGPDGTVKIRYRVEDVSKNHQGQDFCLLVGVANRSDIAHGIGPPVKIRSKRNKRCRGGQNAKTSKSTKKVARAEDHNLRATIQSVSAWAEDVARTIYPWQQNDPIFRELLVRYDKQVRIGLKRVGNVLQNPDSTESPIIYPSPQPVPSNYSRSQHWPTRHFPTHNNAQQPQPSEHFTRWSPRHYRTDAHGANHMIYPNPGACMVPRDANTLAADVVLGRACEQNGRVLGLPVFSLDNELVGFLQPNGAVRRDFDDAQKASALSMLNRKEIPRFSRHNDGADYLQRAIAAVRFQKLPTKPMNEVQVPVVGVATESSEKLMGPARPGRSRTPDSDIAEGDVEFIVSRTFKSLESGEVLGFPAYSAEKQLVGFYKQNQGGEHQFVGLPDAFQAQQLRAAKEVLERAGDSVQSRSRHRSVSNMINHALVFEFSHDIVQPADNRGHDI